MFSLKRKFFKTEKGDIGMSGSFRGQERRWKKKLCPRKPKNQSKMAKKDEYDKARKENLCLNCFELGHAKATCPELTVERSSNDAKKDAKPSKEVHTMQRLPLNSKVFKSSLISYERHT